MGLRAHHIHVCNPIAMGLRAHRHIHAQELHPSTDYADFTNFFPDRIAWAADPFDPSTGSG